MTVEHGYRYIGATTNEITGSSISLSLRGSLSNRLNRARPSLQGATASDGHSILSLSLFVHEQFIRTGRGKDSDRSILLDENLNPYEFCRFGSDCLDRNETEKSVIKLPNIFVLRVNSSAKQRLGLKTFLLLNILHRSQLTLIKRPVQGRLPWRGVSVTSWAQSSLTE
nr:PREDICTED: uncharacterized protein LOC105663258 [Megachile rotundata]